MTQVITISHPSGFPDILIASRVTAGLAARRNEFVAALADEVFIARATTGGYFSKTSFCACERGRSP